MLDRLEDITEEGNDAAMHYKVSLFDSFKTLYHTITTFNDPVKETLLKPCFTANRLNAGNQHLFFYNVFTFAKINLSMSVIFHYRVKPIGSDDWLHGF